MQVPVKSIEDELEYRVRTVLARVRMAEKHDEPYPREWVNNQIGAGRGCVRALLSQPTPSAEPKQLSPDAMQRALDYHGWPPRIEDMAPGTTFTAEARFLVDVHGTPLAHSGFDPSTIRDVTPPKEPTA